MIEYVVPNKKKSVWFQRLRTLFSTIGTNIWKHTSFDGWICNFHMFSELYFGMTSFISRFLTSGATHDLHKVHVSLLISFGTRLEEHPTCNWMKFHSFKFVFFYFIRHIMNMYAQFSVARQRIAQLDVKIISIILPNNKYSVECA